MVHGRMVAEGDETEAYLGAPSDLLSERTDDLVNSVTCSIDVRTLTASRVLHKDNVAAGCCSG